MKQQPWISSALPDLFWVLSPAFWPLVPILLFPDWVASQAKMDTFWWLVLVMLVDVSHVYSTLYRTYFSSDYRQRQRLYLLLPLLAWVGGVALYAMGALIFWRSLAYIAVFHFIRQQYGFIRIYSRKQEQKPWQRRLDAMGIYAATGYPILFWHSAADRQFHWFVKGDFLHWELPMWPLLVCYLAILCAWASKEIWIAWQEKAVNLPKWLLMLGTALSWYLGIVHFNADWVFTAFNVLAHGVPYMALVWFYGKKEPTANASRINRWVFGWRFGLLLFMAILFALAWVEEALWDQLFWHEHASIFGEGWLPSIAGEWALLLVPLLTLPQLTHYLLDGFIWKMRKGGHTQWAKWVLKG